MAGLEELMAGLFGDLLAPGGDEMRRRGGRGGIAGPQQMPGMMQQYYGGTGGWDYSGAMGRDFAGDGGRGLMALLSEQGRDLSGPAMRHFANQGFDFMPPGQDNREKPGGPNIAPGNIDNAQALFQPQGLDHVPGVPQGVAVGQAPGQIRPRPQTQGWRNVHPGYSAAAAVGTDQYGRPQFGGGVRPPGAAGAPPGASIGGGGGGRPAGGGGGGGAPASQNAIGGGGAPVRPGAGGGGSQGTSGGASSGGKNTQGGQAPPGVTPAVKQQSREQGTARGGVGSEGIGAGTGVARDRTGAPIISEKTGGVTNRHGQPVFQGPGIAPGDRVAVPNRGNNNTPSETRGAPEQGKLAGLSPAEKAARKAAWEAKVAAKQERQRQAVAAKSGQYAAPDSRGTGTAPLPSTQKGVGGSTRGAAHQEMKQAGKTKTKSTSRQQR